MYIKRRTKPNLTKPKTRFAINLTNPDTRNYSHSCKLGNNSRDLFK